MRNLAQLLQSYYEHHGDNPFGMIDSPEPYSAAFERARRLATVFLSGGAEPGRPVALIGENGLEFLTAWMALQLAGAEAALVNPRYPGDLLSDMLDDLRPQAVVKAGAVALPETQRLPVIDVSDVCSDKIAVKGRVVPLPEEADEMPGLDAIGSATAGYMHTSGTSGRPKFCVQSQEYFLSLGRFIADGMGLSHLDRIFAPLPLFHINPLGYGVIGGLVAGASIFSAPRFSASRFWADVRQEMVTALILHGPPLDILKRASAISESRGHQVRVVLYSDDAFLEMFDIPLGLSVYGSTEGGGLSHYWLWRKGERCNIPEGMARYGGRCRHDFEWQLNSNSEIEVRALNKHRMFGGYYGHGAVSCAVDEMGWFATGDIGRRDADGNLIFIERRTESIRVKGEYVPIAFVEQRFRVVSGVGDLALWKRDGVGPLEDDHVALYVTGPDVDVEALKLAAQELPKFMRPQLVVQVDEIPRDPGVGKVQRRRLSQVTEVQRWALA